MSDPFRLRVQKALGSLLQSITPANGFTNDLSEKVFRGVARFGNGDPLPLVSILEPLDPGKMWLPADVSPATVGYYPLILQGFVEDDPVNPTDKAHVLMAEVKKALAEAKTRGAREHNILGLGYQGNCVQDIVIGGGVVRPADDYSSTAYFWLTINLKISENMANPYA